MRGVKKEKKKGKKKGGGGGWGRERKDKKVSLQWRKQLRKSLEDRCRKARLGVTLKASLSGVQLLNDAAFY